jgi:hypothetical protein
MLNTLTVFNMENIEQYIKYSIIRNIVDSAKYDWEYLADKQHVIGLIYKTDKIRKFYHFNKPVKLTDNITNDFKIIKENEVYFDGNTKLPYFQDIEEYAKAKNEMINSFTNELKTYANTFNRFLPVVFIDCLSEFFISYTDKYSYIKNKDIDINISV